MNNGHFRCVVGAEWEGCYCMSVFVRISVERVGGLEVHAGSSSVHVCQGIHIRVSTYSGMISHWGTNL